MVLLVAEAAACAKRADLKGKDHESTVVFFSSGEAACAKRADLKNKDHEIIVVL